MPDGPLDRAILTVDGDVDGDGVSETGVFEFVGNLSISPGIRTGFIVDGQGATVNSVVSTLTDDGESGREGVYVDLGGGARTVDIEFRGWKGAYVDGDYVQWGDSPSPGRTSTSATAQGPLTQLDVLMEYLDRIEIDSRSPAILEYGEHYDQGLYEPMEVVVEGPTLTHTAEDGNAFDGVMTLISAKDLREIDEDMANVQESASDWLSF